MTDFEVWDSAGTVLSILFPDEKKANSYREKMEKKYGRAFRIRKIFSSGNEQYLDPPVEDFRQISLNAIPGDIVHSESGFLADSPIDGKRYLVKSFRVTTNGGLVALEMEEYAV